MDIAATYDRMAEEWHRDHAHDDWWVECTDEFIALLPKVGTVLDVGCGSGVKSKYLLERGLTVMGIDISKNLLAIAKREAPAGSYRELSMLDLDQLSEQYDGVFAQASLLHIPKQQALSVIKLMAARCKPGGYLYLALKEAPPGRPEEEILKEDTYGYPMERFFSYYTMPELESTLASAGLTLVHKHRKASPSGRTIWLQLIAKKPP